MKWLFIALVLNITGMAQTTENRLIERIPELIQSKIRWSSLGKNAISVEEKNTVAQCIRDPANAFCLDPRIDGDYMDDFYFVDLDNDKDLDIIYEGFECAGHSGKTVLVYLNKNDRYENVLRAAGKLVLITPGTELILYRYPCCSMIENTMIRYSLKPDLLTEEGGLSFFYSPIINFAGHDFDHMLPGKLKTGDRYKVPANAMVYYTPKDSISNKLLVPQSIAGYVNAECLIQSYASYKDNAGETWIYGKLAYQYMTLHNKKAEYPLLIWIKLKDCIKIN